jgi:Ca2+-binding RTX toxin-like protein
VREFEGMTTLNVPGTYPTISAAVAAAIPGDVVLVAAGYGGNEAVDVAVDNLTFNAPAGVPNIVLSAGAGVLGITLAGESPIRIIGNTANNNFIGNAGANDISDGGGGNDRIDGGGGDDTIRSSGGTDTLIGGDGNDTFLIDDPVGGSVDGGAGSDTVHAVDLGGYTFSNVETLDTYYGFITASVSQVASFGNLTAIFGTADTQIVVSLRGAGGTLDFSTRINGENSLGIRDAGLTSAINITGSANDDYLFGSAFNDVLKGGAGADTLVGGAGRDTLIGNEGADILSGGAGNDILIGNGDGDTATYFDATGVRVNLAITTAQNTLSAGADTLSGISNLVGSDYADRLTGDGNANQLDGGAGNDTLDGGAGDDVLLGGDGNDHLLGSAGADRYDGGLGIDVADFRTMAGVQIFLDGSHVNAGDATGDSFVGVERLIGSQTDSDWLVGDGDDNMLVGLGGDDILEGGGGNDILDGGDGNDTLSGGDGNDGFRASAGADHFDGGAGTDYVNYGPSTGAQVFLDGSGTNARAAVGDTFTGVENLVGSLTGIDWLVGDSNANRLTGQGGNDILWGRGGIDQLEGGDGDDRLVGGTGADVMAGGAGSDTFVFDQKPLLASERDRIVDFTSGQDHLEIDASIFGGGLVAGGTVDLVAGSNPSSSGHAGATFLYNTGTGFLSFDADGQGSHAAVTFAWLQNVPTITAGDFTIVA